MAAVQMQQIEDFCNRFITCSDFYFHSFDLHFLTCCHHASNNWFASVIAVETGPPLCKGRRTPLVKRNHHLWPEFLPPFPLSDMVELYDICGTFKWNIMSWFKVELEGPKYPDTLIHTYDLEASGEDAEKWLGNIERWTSQKSLPDALAPGLHYPWRNLQ